MDMTIYSVASACINILYITFAVVYTTKGQIAHIHLPTEAHQIPYSSK